MPSNNCRFCLQISADFAFIWKRSFSDFFVFQSRICFICGSLFFRWFFFHIQICRFSIIQYEPFLSRFQRRFFQRLILRFHSSVVSESHCHRFPNVFPMFSQVIILTIIKCDHISKRTAFRGGQRPPYKVDSPFSSWTTALVGQWPPHSWTAPIESGQTPSWTECSPSWTSL